MITVSIQQQFGEIGINIIRPRVEGQLRLPEMTLEQSKPVIDLAITWPEVIVDLTQPFAEIGLAQPVALAREHAGAAVAAAEAGTARRAQVGDALARIKGPSIGQLAYEGTIEEKEVNIDAIPKTPPEIDLAPGRVKVIYTPWTVDTDLHWGRLDWSASRGYVDVYEAQKPYIKISATGLIFDQHA